jgi:CoA:oxalate CoA-transferase
MTHSDNHTINGPLKGVNIVDLTRPVAGATCTWILSNMGAETIKIEQPREDVPVGISYLYTGKKSVTLNLKTEEGKEILRSLIKWGDVLVENYRPGVMLRLGFDYPKVREINPRIIMTSISGYGQTGPYSQRGGLDTVGQGMAGLMSLIGEPGSPPMDAGTNIADVSSGVFGALGTTLALYHQKVTGQGQHVEATLTESIAFFVVDQLVKNFRGLAIEKGSLAWWKRLPGAGWFQAKDGPWIIIMAENDEHWRPMAAILGRADLATATGYSVRVKRSEHAVEIHKLMEDWVASLTANEVEKIVAEAGIPFGRVQTLAEVQNDPQLKARGMFKDVDLNGETIPLFGPYPILSETPGSFRKPPKLGEHNSEIYGDLLGFSPEKLATLKTRGVI